MGGWSKMEMYGECRTQKVLAYADDIVEMGETREEDISTASKLLKNIGLCINTFKRRKDEMFNGSNTAISAAKIMCALCRAHGSKATYIWGAS
jgi:hypothetical protein